MTKKEWLHHRYEDAKLAYCALMKCYPLTLDDLDGEIWRVVDEHYHLSNFGRVKSFWKGKAKIRKPKIHTSGYLNIPLFKDGKKKDCYVHRLVAEFFIPNPDAKPEVNHKDNNPFNNYVGNLEWVTSSENKQHSFDIGVAPQGSDRPDAKFTAEQIIYVRNNPDASTTRQLAKQFDVHVRTIRRIQIGQTYKTEGGTIRAKKIIHSDKYSCP